MPPSSQESLAALDAVRQNVTYTVFGLLAQTFVFGIYTLLLCLSTRILLKRGLRTGANSAMLIITLFMYFLSAGYWAHTVSYTANLLNRAPLRSLISSRNGITQSSLANAIGMINFVLGDGVVLWRAQIISPRKLRKFLWVSRILLVFGAAAVLTTIGLRIAPAGNQSNLTGIMQLVSWMVSLASNISAISVVTIAAWSAERRRRMLKASAIPGEGTKSDGNWALAVEMGAFYCMTTFMILPLSFIQLPQGRLGDIYAPIAINLAGVYPLTVILLIRMKTSFELDILPAESSLSYPVFPSPFASPTANVGGPDRITGPDVVRPLKRIISEPKNSRFSDASIDRGKEVLSQLQKTAML
ncbi:hypothetical protein C8R47DRAFT_471019 [Mycena vitilis]|nr:hypothetical protein C8R47DRAFT_471019 [Mycena vitilis]